MGKHKYMELIILLIFIIGGIVPLIKPFYIIDKFPNLSVQIYISFIYWVVNKLHRFIWKRDTLIIPHIYFVAMCVAPPPPYPPVKAVPPPLYPPFVPLPAPPTFIYKT